MNPRLLQSEITLWMRPDSDRLMLMMHVQVSFPDLNTSLRGMGTRLYVKRVLFTAIPFLWQSNNKRPPVVNRKMAGLRIPEGQYTQTIYGMVRFLFVLNML